MSPTASGAVSQRLAYSVIERCWRSLLSQSAHLTKASSVKISKPRWLWPGRLAYGKLAVLDGNPGQGKSTLTLDLAARVSRGKPMPGAASGQTPSGVVLLNAEDSLDDTIVPRLMAANADLERVVALESMGDRPWSLPGDIPALEEAVWEVGASLVVIDPLMAFLHASHDSQRDHDVRRALHPLADMARRTCACVLVVRHLRKAGGKAIHAGGGSVGIGGAARSVLLAAENPDIEGDSVLAVTKNNLGPKGHSYGYRLVTDEALGSGKIEWLGPSGHTADSLLGE
jgi:RecA-family ATPase